VATLDAEELQRCVSRDAAPAIPARRGADAVIEALERLDASEAHRLLSSQLSALGPVRFAQEYARPLVHEIGDRWATERLSIASEHLATGVLRSLLGSALVPDAAARTGPVVVFATLSGERHELGLQMAALTAMGAGACPLYLGAELPVESILGAVERAGAAALGLSLVTDSGGEAARTVRALRAALPPAVPLWLGGPASREIPTADGIERIEALDELERRVARLGYEQPAR
jgi:methanogenic corrinoid protein MtbC1